MASWGSAVKDSFSCFTSNWNLLCPPGGVVRNIEPVNGRGQNWVRLAESPKWPNVRPLSLWEKAMCIPRPGWSTGMAETRWKRDCVQCHWPQKKRTSDGVVLSIPRLTSSVNCGCFTIIIHIRNAPLNSLFVVCCWRWGTVDEKKSTSLILYWTIIVVGGSLYTWLRQVR